MRLGFRLFSCLVLCPAAFVETRGQEASSPSISIVVTTKTTEPTYKVSGKAVKGAALPDALVDEKRAKGTSAKVAVVFDGKTRFETFFFVAGTLGKLGFERLDYYVMDDHQRTMVEVRLGKGNIPVADVLGAKP